MFRFKQSLITAAGLSLVISLLALVTPTRTQGQGGNQQPLSVSVVNTDSRPVPVREVGDPARQAVQVQSACVIASFQPFLGCTPADHYTVPAGKRLVIEYASLKAFLPPGQAAVMGIETILNNEPVKHSLPQTPAVVTTNPLLGDGSLNVVTTGQQMRIYGDGSVTVKAERTGDTGSATFIFTISGYLVDVP